MESTTTYCMFVCVCVWVVCVFNNLIQPFHGKFGMHVYNCVRLNVPFNFYLKILTSPFYSKWMLLKLTEIIYILYHNMYKYLYR